MVLCGQKVGIDQAPERQSQSYATWMTAAVPVEWMVMDETTCMCIVDHCGYEQTEEVLWFFYFPRIRVRFYHTKMLSHHR